MRLNEHVTTLMPGTEHYARVLERVEGEEYSSSLYGENFFRGCAPRWASCLNCALGYTLEDIRFGDSAYTRCCHWSAPREHGLRDGQAQKQTLAAVRP